MLSQTLAVTIAIIGAAAGSAQTHPWELASERTTQLFREGKWGDATRSAEEAVKAAETAFGAAHLNVAQSLDTLAILYSVQRRFSEAAPIAQRALSIYEQQFGKNAREIITPAKILGANYVNQGNLDAAEPLLKRALELSLKFFGTRSAETAKQLGNMGGLYLSRKKPAEARRYLEQALAIWGERPDPVYGATTLVNLATVHADAGDIEGADRLFRKALAIREKAFGRDHPQTKMAADNYADFLKKTGRPGK